MEGGAYLAPGDYATLLQMILNDGRCGDVQVLSPEAVEQMLSDRIGEVYEGSTFTGTGYGLGWWVDRERGYRTDPGAYGAVPWLDVEDGYGVYLVIEATSGVGSALAEKLYAPVDTAVSGT